MAEPLEDLMVRLSVQGKDKFKADLAEAQWALNSVGGGFTKTGAAATAGGKSLGVAGDAAGFTGRHFSLMQVPILNAAMALTAAAYAADRVGRALYAVSGINIAAQMESAEFSIGKLTGGMDKAGGLMELFRQQAADSPFRRTAAELAEYSESLIATGSSASAAAAQIKVFEDAAAATGNAKLTPTLSNLMARMRSEPHAMIRQLLNLDVRGLNLQDILQKGAGIKTQNPEQAAEILGSMYGPRVFDLIMRGLENAFKGSAMERVQSTFLGAINSIANTAQQVMEPTGRLLLMVLEPVGRMVKNLTDLALWMNKGTGGVLGLVTAGYGLYRVKMLLIVSYNATIGAVQRLTLAINELAMSANMGANRMGMPGGFDPNMRQSFPIYGGPRNAFRFGGLPALARYAALSMARNPMAGLLAGMGLQMGGGAVGGGAGHVMESTGAGLQIGAIAAMLPMPLPMKAAAIGLGTLAGLLKGIYDNTHKTAEESTAANTTRATDWGRPKRAQNYRATGGGILAQSNVAARGAWRYLVALNKRGLIISPLIAVGALAEKSHGADVVAAHLTTE